MINCLKTLVHLNAPSIKRQLRNHKKIFNQAVFEHFYSKINKES